MSFKKIILAIFITAIIIGGYFIYDYLQKEGIKYPDFVKVENVKFKSFAPLPKLNFRLTADIILNNPNPISLEITEIDLEIFLNGNKSTTVQQNINTEMKANSDFVLPLEFEVPISDKNFIKNIGEFLTGAWKKKVIDIRYLGVVKIKSLKVPISIPIDFEESYPIEEYLYQ